MIKSLNFIVIYEYLNMPLMHNIRLGCLASRFDWRGSEKRVLIRDSTFARNKTASECSLCLRGSVDQTRQISERAKNYPTVKYKGKAHSMHTRRE